MLSPAKLAFICKYFPYSICTGLQQTRLFDSLVKMTTEPKMVTEKKRILELPLEEKRKLYRSQDFLIVDKVDPWCNYVIRNKHLATKKHTLDDLNEFKKITLDPELNKKLSEKVSIYKGDITKLEVDAIVNAANSLLRAGGGVDGAIHRAAGPLLQQECNTLGGCPTGQAKVTGGYDLPAKYVIHTVGPQDGSAPALQKCYINSLAHHKEYNIQTIAFPCISTGIYGFPNRLAAHIALQIARQFLEKNEKFERIIFCTFMPIDIDIYETLLQMYFPVQEWNYNDGASATEKGE
ncbi:macro domain-containing protein RSc0334-like [Pectinophora gossypiella]|uniref:macro domain-containing protein RSc0334-like n=1 Tax=Pectinophora gossypiella TaxID=13191 RepID=UPI00214F0D26|nr:macro domain-containing protein RSc0334-like [Pectinophora gossypiella]